MPRHFRNGRGYYRGGSPFKGAIWMIGLGVLFFTGKWWPGILILVGISILLGAFWQNPEPPTPPRQETSWNWDRPEQPPRKPEAERPSPPPPESTRPAVPPPNTAPRFDLLPSTCPSCGAPVRANDLKWTGSHTATCSYCGSTIRAVKN